MKFPSAELAGWNEWLFPCVLDERTLTRVVVAEKMLLNVRRKMSVLPLVSPVTRLVAALWNTT